MLWAVASPYQPLNDVEGARVPAGVRVIDAHVHLFPDRVFDAIWRWFDEHAWPVRYRLRSEEIIEFQLSRGVERIVALTYAHVPDMAESLNAYVAELAERHPQVIALGTVLPGEPDTRAIVNRARWGAWVLLGFFVAVLTYAAQVFAPVIAGPFWMITPSEAADVVQEGVLAPLAIAAFVIAREVR